MLSLNAAALAHLAQESRRLTVCGVLTKEDGTNVRCTIFDDDVKVVGGDLAGLYLSTSSITASDIKSSSDLSSDNLEARGALSDAGAGFAFTGFNVADLVAGQYHSAPFEIFICQWDAPSDWQKVVHRGYLGQIVRTAEGAFTAEWRGIMQILQQNIGRVYGELCDVVSFGDTRCKLDINHFTYTATVTAVTSRRGFTVGTITPFSLPALTPAVNYFNLGHVLFTSGLNVNYRKQIKLDSAGSPLALGTFQLWESTPFDIQVGDTVHLIAGCDRRYETCKAYGNTVNFRGHGRWIPGMPKIIRAPGANPPVATPPGARGLLTIG